MRAPLLIAATLSFACSARTPPAPESRSPVSQVIEVPRVEIVTATLDASAAPDALDASLTDAADVTDAPTAQALSNETITVLIRQVAVYFEPRVEPEWNGSLRAGARVRVLRGPLGHDQCGPYERRPDTGWYEIEHDGYVCVSRGAVLTRHLSRVLRGPLPSQPRRTAAMPYRYAMARRETPIYRRLPTIADEHSVEPDRFIEAPEGADEGEEDERRERIPMSLEALEGFEDTPLLRRALRGMIVSLDRPQTAESQASFWRTFSGGWVRASELQFVGAPALHGVALGRQHSLPLRFTVARAAIHAPDARGVMRAGRALPRWSALPFVEGPSVTLRGEEYVPVTGGYVRRRDVRDITAHEPPTGIAQGEKWIDVNLDRQFVVAYEGATPVFATLMSSGIPSREGAESYETIQGSFRIEQKHLTTTMDGNSAAGAYSIEDVPWVMYFSGSFALHGAFWHDDFGRVRSHGCVNLSPDDARWIFQWSSPTLPEGWHSVTAVANDLGTRVFVHYDRQSLGESGGPSLVPGH